MMDKDMMRELEKVQSEITLEQTLKELKAQYRITEMKYGNGVGSVQTVAALNFAIDILEALVRDKEITAAAEEVDEEFPLGEENELLFKKPTGEEYE